MALKQQVDNALTKVFQLASKAGQQPKARRGGEAWKRQQAASSFVEGEVHAVLVSEFRKLINFCLMLFQKSNISQDMDLAASIEQYVKGPDGRLLAGDLMSFFVGWTLSSEQQSRLEKGWLRLTADTKRLLFAATRPL